MAIVSITLAEAKRQCRVRQDETEHDTQIAQLIAAAEKAAVEYCNFESLDDFDEDSPATTMPEDVKLALMLHVQAHFDTDPVQLEQLKKAAFDLLWPYREGLEI